jgi:amidohydrolase
MLSPHAMRSEVLAEVPEMVRLRRDLHQHPELGFQEVRTSAIVAEALERAGLPVRRNVARTGVVALVEGAHPGPTLLMRADMDALPILQENDVPYASLHPGKMHACGHDGHTSILLTTARLLAGRRDRLKGRVKLIFQPAEEGPGGAEPMIAEGVLRDPQVDAAVGLHLWSHLPVGSVGVSPGPFMAAADTFSIRVRGRGGHAAAPQQCVDPVAVGLTQGRLVERRFVLT